MIKEGIQWTVSPHAKQRAWERYGVRFSPRKWVEFCRIMQKEKNLIHLENHGSEGCRFACCFHGQWFFIGCRLYGGHGMVSTFLPAEALTDTDKIILASDNRYKPIGDVSWNVMHQKLSGRTTRNRRTHLSDIQISPDELPPDFDQVGKLLEHKSQKYSIAKSSDDA